MKEDGSNRTTHKKVITIMKEESERAFLPLSASASWSSSTSHNFFIHFHYPVDFILFPFVFSSMNLSFPPIHSSLKWNLYHKRQTEKTFHVMEKKTVHDTSSDICRGKFARVQLISHSYQTVWLNYRSFYCYTLVLNLSRTKGSAFTTSVNMCLSGRMSQRDLSRFGKTDNKSRGRVDVCN